MMSIQETAEGLIVSDGHRCVTASKPEHRIRRENRTGGECVAPMPGFIVGMWVHDGDVVEAGATLLTMEAMKMQMQITSPTAGQVTIQVSEGQAVNKGCLLAIVKQIGC